MTHNNTQNTDLSDFFRRNARVGRGFYSLYISDHHYDRSYGRPDPALDNASFEIMDKEFSRDHFQGYASVGMRFSKLCVTRVGDTFEITGPGAYGSHYYDLKCHIPVKKRGKIIREKRDFIALWLKKPPCFAIGIIPPEQPCPENFVNLWLPGMGAEMYTNHLRLKLVNGIRWWTVSASGIETGARHFREEVFRQPDSGVI